MAGVPPEDLPVQTDDTREELEAQPHLEAENTDSDSAYGESTKSSFLTSIASEVTRGLFENGRRYHSYGQAEYAFPNDERETDRLDMQHAMMVSLMRNRLHWAPIDPQPLKVLDLGTGTGIWCIDFAEIFESADVTGTDLSPIQPSWVPPNCKFEIDDASKDWTFQRDSFDYIHARNLVCSIRDWPKLIKQCYQHTRPGGWVEWQHKHPWIVSDDNTLPENSALEEWSKNLFEAAARFGAPFEDTLRIRELMEQAGFVDVQQHVVKLPIGPWPKDKRLKKVGAFEMVNMVDGIEGLSIRLFSKALGMSMDAIQVNLMAVRNEARNSKIHSYYPFYIIFGRKPESSSETAH